MKNKKIIIAMPTEQEFMPSIARWGRDFNWCHCEVHFVHIIRQTYEVSEMSVVDIPDPATLSKLKETNLTFLQKKAHEILPETAFENAHFKVLSDTSPPDKMVEYAKEIDASMIVIATRNKRGLAGFFTSSFAERMLTFSPCDILVLRPDKK